MAVSESSPDGAASGGEFSVDQFRLLADNVPALIATYDADTRRCLFANQQYARAFGHGGQEVVGRTFAELIGEEAAHEIQPHVDRVLEDRVAVLYERRVVDRDGRPRWLEVHLLPHLDAAGRPREVFVLISDISKHRLAEAAVRESEERLAAFMAASAEGIAFHQDGLVTDANPPLLALIGYELHEILGRHVLSFIAPGDLQRVRSVMDAGRETSYELSILHKDGHELPVEFIVRTMLRNGRRLRMTIVRDMRDRHAAQARIQHLAHHDPLTGLPNRSAFMERLDQLISGSRDSDHRLALLFVDLDHFKRVNDSLGHLAGDALLKTVAQRIEAGVRTTDVVARFGGDEFIVLIPGAPREGDVADIAAKLLAALAAPVDVEGRSISVTPSIGIAMYPTHGSTPAELIKHADTAMYAAKTRGRANAQFFEPAMASAAYEALLLESQLALALERREFELHYQPQVRAGDGRLVGAEALIRWRHSERGLLMPDAFIPVAEQRQLMRAIGRWTLREALRSARAWQPADGPAVPVAVNLSSVEFTAPDFVETVARILREEGTDGTLLELELTERMLMDDTDAVTHVLAGLKRLGIRIAVDDFGTGYSSLGHLKDLPIDKIKIDRSFVHELPQGHGSAAIARAIVQLSQSLGLVAVAEGVETVAQRDFLLQLGCDELQGTLVGPPLSGDAFVAWALGRA
jgi:diguanylate cyclase (GGDEF)-like protein/PAS domain S-box-containing protein